jgi:hypothetical protein
MMIIIYSVPNLAMIIDSDKKLVTINSEKILSHIALLPIDYDGSSYSIIEKDIQIYKPDENNEITFKPIFNRSIVVPYIKDKETLKELTAIYLYNINGNILFTSENCK